MSTDPRTITEPDPPRTTGTCLQPARCSAIGPFHRSTLPIIPTKIATRRPVGTFRCDARLFAAVEGNTDDRTSILLPTHRSSHHNRTRRPVQRAHPTGRHHILPAAPTPRPVHERLQNPPGRSPAPLTRSDGYPDPYAPLPARQNEPIRRGSRPAVAESLHPAGIPTPCRRSKE